MDPRRLAAIPLFSGLPESELSAVAAVAHAVEVVDGAPLAVEGDFGHAVFAIEQGTADVTSNGERIRAVGPGDVVGEVAVLASGRRTASIVATSAMRVISIFKRDVWALERSAPEAARRLRDLIATHDSQ